MGVDRVVLKTREEIEKLRRANVIVAEIHEYLKGFVKPGATTLDLETLCVEELRKRGVRPAFKGYRGYPFCLCTSVNEQVVHGMPDGRLLEEGDILSIDFGVLLDGFYGDAAFTHPVGEVSDEAASLMRVTAESLEGAIEAAKVGNRLLDISFAIQSHVESAGYSVVKEFVGHGIGRELHEPPQVPNFGTPGMGLRLKEGMVLAIEPMVNVGAWQVKVLEDGWTAVTSDGKLSAHFEHSVAITAEGPYVLSRI